MTLFKHLEDGYNYELSLNKKFNSLSDVEIYARTIHAEDVFSSTDKAFYAGRLHAIFCNIPTDVNLEDTKEDKIMRLEELISRNALMSFKNAVYLKSIGK